MTTQKNRQRMYNIRASETNQVAPDTRQPARGFTHVVADFGENPVEVQYQSRQVFRIVKVFKVRKQRLLIFWECPGNGLAGN